MSQDNPALEDQALPLEDPSQLANRGSLLDLLSFGGGGFKSRGCFSTLGVLCFIGVLALLGSIVIPNFMRAQARNGGTACRSNLKNIGTAFEMYSTDWSGKYPTALSQLTPNYLKTIPECPSAGLITYTVQTGLNATYNTEGFVDYYFIQCEGSNHTAFGVPANYPQYDGIRGLIDR
jgi:type II secretory pathway pseudopilin PulG